MKKTSSSKSILIICTGNSARSQMGEGLFRHLGGEKVIVKSAGTHPTTVHPYAIRVMDEIGIDISHHTSKSVHQFLGQSFDYVITVCDQAREECPYFPGGKQFLHHSFRDPASFHGTEEEMLAFFREIRDEMQVWVQDFLTNHLNENQLGVTVSFKPKAGQ